VFEGRPAGFADLDVGFTHGVFIEDLDIIPLANGTLPPPAGELTPYSLASVRF
jgi:hypothetical protein